MPQSQKRRIRTRQYVVSRIRISNAITPPRTRGAPHPSTSHVAYLNESCRIHELEMACLEYLLLIHVPMLRGLTDHVVTSEHGISDS